MVVFCDEGTSTATELHASFRVGRHKPVVTLADASGQVLDQVEGPDFAADAGYARFPDGGALWLDTPTTSRGTTNGTLVTRRAAGTLSGDGAVVELDTLRSADDCAGGERRAVAEFAEDVLATAPWIIAVATSSASAFSSGSHDLSVGAGDGVVDGSDWAVADPSCRTTWDVAETETCILSLAGARLVIQVYPTPTSEGDCVATELELADLRLAVPG